MNLAVGRPLICTGRGLLFGVSPCVNLGRWLFLNGVYVWSGLVGCWIAHIYGAKWGKCQTTFFGFREILGFSMCPLLTSPGCVVCGKRW